MKLRKRSSRRSSAGRLRLTNSSRKIRGRLRCKTIARLMNITSCGGNCLSEPRKETKAHLPDGESFSKDCRPYSHAGRSLLDRNFKIVGHSHREDAHVQRHMPGSDLIAQIAQSLEIEASLLQIICERRNSHQATKIQIV